MTSEDKRWLEGIEDSIKPGKVWAPTILIVHIKKLVAKVRELDGHLHGTGEGGEV